MDYWESRVLQVLAQSEEGKTVEQIANLVGGDYYEVREVLEALVENGKVAELESSSFLGFYGGTTLYALNRRR